MVGEGEGILCMGKGIVYLCFSLKRDTEAPTSNTNCKRKYGRLV